MLLREPVCFGSAAPLPAATTDEVRWLIETIGSADQDNWSSKALNSAIWRVVEPEGNWAFDDDHGWMKQDPEDTVAFDQAPDFLGDPRCALQIARPDCFIEISLAAEGTIRAMLTRSTPDLLVERRGRGLARQVCLACLDAILADAEAGLLKLGTKLLEPVRG